MQQNKVKEYVISALLVALSILIPMFMPIKIIMPPFTMTLAAHVPSILAMFIGPVAVILTGIGSVIGFMPLGPEVMARAAMHIVFGLAGCYMIKKEYNYLLIIIITMILHGISEALIVIPFIQFTIANGGAVKATEWIVLFGTMIHHAIDFAIATPILYALNKGKFIGYKLNFKKKG